MVLLGPSGSGKATLLRLVAGIDRASAGSIAIGSHVVADQQRHLSPERRSLAMVFQDYALWPQVSVSRTSSTPWNTSTSPAGRPGGVPWRCWIGWAWPDWPTVAPQNYRAVNSNGVALARALVARPAVLLCDEPLSHLDADLRERLRAEIAELARENDTTVVYITHDQVEAFALADQIGVLQAGRLVQCDLPESVYNAPATPFVARFTGVAGELHGHVAGQQDSAGRFRVNTPSGPLEAFGRAPEPLGSAVTVLVRPAAARLVSAADDNGLLSRVQEVAYRGHGYDHLVELADGTRLAGVFAEQRRQRGEEVRVRLDPGGCFAYRVDTDA